MDLVTLVAACALTLDPKVMHALIWHQSGGEPWSFSVAGKSQPQVYRSAREAVREARTALPQGVPIRIGLTGLAVDSTSTTTVIFTPCPNISMAARQITQLVERCKTVSSFKADPIHCAIAAYGGSWDRPDNKFADMVVTSAANGDAPNFDMTDDTDVGTGEFVPEARDTRQHPSTLSPRAPDDQQRGWSSALFPPRSQQLGRVATGTSSSTQDADRLQESSELSAPATAARSPDDGLFVRRLPERRPQ
jgi:Transglycosylase SLT domain